ncbi:MAG: hypothetical protein OQK76_05490 [Gammaproteobacteria bacterium]|nr:hypothetical protein [Gammaproteobacteria bacterium]MCW8910057.1 hypothetical protein [Gammaproteobacteria bacterium]MCW9006243.1 hypothetical protein [Gammaproteobacteria bacterium]MCW9055434.1 hypothetical protein [Gammaproteobacteria bacterium]
MSLFKNHMAVIAIPIINFLFSSNLFAADIYVDSNLSSDCTTGNYSTTNRNCSGSDGNAYNTIQEAVNNLNTSDDIYIRGGTYYENVLISGRTSPNGTADDYITMQSYPGEWAIVDGQNNEQYTIGKNRSGRDEGNDLAYWKFERLEITGGTDGSSGGAGLYLNGGPFIVRYCYIHDNVASAASNNPGGIVGYTWTDSIIEYNYLENNGDTGGDDGNSANIAIFGDYLQQTTGRDGFTNSIPSTRRNEIRYNYISGSSIGFKHKGAQLFTGRNPGTSDYDDTYKDWGDKIHHNYFIGQRRISLLIEQDFAQAYNNIFDNSPAAITVNYEPNFQLYKVITYNNTIINPRHAAIKRYGCDYFPFTENESHYGADFNNIIDSHDKEYGHWFTSTAINVFNGCGSYNPTYTNPDISNYFMSHNYFYRPDDADIFDYGYPSVFYTVAEFEAQSETGGSKVAYTNPYDAGNRLYKGTTGANKFKTLGSHLIEGTTTIANGGIAIPHPYLSGITLPSYLGAVNPNDSNWIDDLLCLTDIEVLKKGGTGGPVCTVRPKIIDTLEAN